MSDIQRKVTVTSDSSGLRSDMDSTSSSVSKSFDKINQSADNVSRGFGKMSDTFQRKLLDLDKTTATLFKGIVQDSEKRNKSLKDRVAYMEKEVKLVERIGKEERLRARETLTGKYKEDLKKSSPGLEQQEMIKGYKKKFGELNEDEEIEDRKIKSLRAETDEYREREEEKRRSGGGGGGGYGGIVNTGRNIGGTVLGALGLASILSGTGLIAKTISEGSKLDAAAGGYGGLLKGGKDSALLRVPAVAMYGLSQADQMSYNKNFGLSRGKSEGNLTNILANRQLGFERAYGLDEGSLNSGNILGRATKNGRTSEDISLEMLNFFKKAKLFNIDKGDYTLLAEKIEFGNQLSMNQTQQKERVDASFSSGLLALGGKIGGSFGDFRATDTFGKINQSLVSPHNDFTQAFLFRTLRNANPNASFMDIKQRQEEGIYGKGTLSQLMKDLTQSFSGESLVFATQKMTGLRISQSRALVDTYQKNPEIMGMLKDENSMKKYLSGYDGAIGTDEINERAEGNTGIVRKHLAEFETKLGTIGESTLKAFDDLIKSSSDLSDIFKKIWNYAEGIRKEAIEKQNLENERKETKKSLKEYDVDKSGSIESREMTTLYSNLLGKGGHKQTSEEAKILSAIYGVIHESINKGERLSFAGAVNKIFSSSDASYSTTSPQMR